MKQSVSSDKYYLGDVKPYCNAFGGVGLHASLFLNEVLLAQIKEFGDGTSPAIAWEIKDHEINDLDIESLTHWVANEDGWSDTPDIDDAVWYLCHRWEVSRRAEEIISGAGRENVQQHILGKHTP